MKTSIQKQADKQEQHAYSNFASTDAGSEFAIDQNHSVQAEKALLGLSRREHISDLPAIDAIFLQILHTLSDVANIGSYLTIFEAISTFLNKRREADLPKDPTTWLEFATLTRRLAERVAEKEENGSSRESAIKALNIWADSLETAIDALPTLESFTGKVDLVEGDIAYVSFVDSAGKESFSDGDAKKLAQKGIVEGSTFTCLIKEQGGKAFAMLAPIPRRELSDEEWQKMRQETEEAIGDWKIEDDY